MKKAIIALVLVLCLCTLPVLFALAWPDQNIKVWPVGTETDTGEPIVTTSPANMMIYTVAGKKACNNVWLLLVLNEETYTGLNYIDVYGVNYAKIEFAKVTASKIPPPEPDGAYPGCEDHEQYAVGSVKDKLGTTGDIYSCIKLVFGSVTTEITDFTITVYLSGSVSDLKVLVLALGRTVGSGTGQFNNGSSYSGSTLIVPELATILLATASLSVFGLYTLKRRK